MRSSLPAKLGLSYLVFASVVGPFTALAQTQRPAEQQTQDRIVITKDEVPLDVVVRNKKGKLIKDLTSSDFEVYEDGVKQEITSFRFASSTGAATNTRAASTPSASSPSTTVTKPTTPTERTEAAGVSAVALVFDRLTPESRLRARDAALSYLGESVRKSELVGVFVTDLSVVVLQPFTYNADQVKAGINKAGLHATSQYASNNQEARVARDAVRIGMLRSQTQSGPPEPGTEALAPAAAMALASLERWEEFQRDQQGNATTHGLLHIAGSLRALPGRKAVILFSEGLVLPTNVQETFRAVINEANRANVSFYAVDVAGLRTESKTAEARKEIESRSNMRMTQLGNNAEVTGPMTKDLERNEDLLRMNPDSGLGQLANDTGGFLITDSNDLKDRLQKVDEDLHSYYLLSYSPNNQKYDGHFRKIEVKLKRSGLTVQSRKGYYAIKGTYSSPVLSYEVPALAALGSGSKSDSFPFYIGGFSFPDKPRIGLAPVMVDVPLSAFTFRVEQTKRVYETDFSIVALLKDHSGQVVSKLSNHYRLDGPMDKVEDAKKGRVLFYAEADLPPDRYTLETIAYDAPSGRASVRTGILEVSASGESKLRLSDVVLLKRAEPVSGGDENKTNPFRVGNMLVSPNLGEPISRSLKQVPFFFTVYAPSSAAKPTLTIELSQGGRALAQMPGQLPESDPSGRSQFVAGLPIEKLPAGAYELKITVSGEGTTLVRARSFTLVD
jgi:VWFA-related protein